MTTEGDSATGGGVSGDTSPPAEPAQGLASDDNTAEHKPSSRGRHRGRKRQRSFWREMPVLIVIALIIAVLVKTFVMQAFYIPSGSMENTLRVNDRVLVNKVSYKVGHVQRGQIIVFDGLDSWTPETQVKPASNWFTGALRDVGSWIGIGGPNEKDFIKRVIGVPGDHVACCDAQGRITVNGVALNEKAYLYPGNNPGDNPAGPPEFSIVVPSGSVWVMGDHRADSADSRAHLGDPGGGTIPESHIIGRAFVKIWPPSHMGWLSIPKTFHQNFTALAAQPLTLGFAFALPLVFARRRWLLSERRRRRRLRT